MHSVTRIEHFSYELTTEPEPSEELKTGKSREWNYPESVGELSKKQATDGSILHFSAQVALLDMHKIPVGHPMQVFLAFARTDAEENQQLQVNAQAVWD